MTIRELIEWLSHKDPNLPVGTVGHYGEFFPMDKYNFHISQTYREGILDRDRQRVEFSCLDISTPYIGEEPD